MACRGVHFSIDDPTVQLLKGIRDEQARLGFVQEQIEEVYFADKRHWLAQTDKAWDWIHRALTDGELAWDNGTYPLNHVILGGELLYTEPDYILSLKTPRQVADAAAELVTISESDFRDGFSKIGEFEIEHSFEEDLEYSWNWFLTLREFWLRAAEEERFVLFTVDQ